MKKVLSLSVLAALALTVGCATGNTADSSANTQITLEQALQKSQETRQQLEQAKSAYQSAKSAAQASKQNGTSIEVELAKQALQNKVNATKSQVDSEVQAWKDVLGK